MPDQYLELLKEYKMKYLFTLLLFTIGQYTKAQAIENSQSLELRAGKVFSAGDYAALRYRHTTSTSIDLSIAGFLNNLHQNGLQYYSYGLDLMGEYYTAVGDNTDHLFELKTGLGITGLVDNEPWIYKDLSFSKRLNYGLAAELTGEWCLSENISLTLFAQQKFLFNHSLSNAAFIGGLGIKLNLD